MFIKHSFSCLGVFWALLNFWSKGEVNFRRVIREGAKHIRPSSILDIGKIKGHVKIFRANKVFEEL